MDRRKRVLNLHESAVDRMLADYAYEHGYRISLKMRLRDVIEIEGLRLNAIERDFAFTSHLDFVAFDAASQLPVQAIEYDGRQHLTDQGRSTVTALRKGSANSPSCPPCASTAFLPGRLAGGVY